jgi:hypothetical protein
VDVKVGENTFVVSEGGCWQVPRGKLFLSFISCTCMVEMMRLVIDRWADRRQAYFLGQAVRDTWQALQGLRMVCASISTKQRMITWFKIECASQLLSSGDSTQCYTTSRQISLPAETTWETSTGELSVNKTFYWQFDTPEMKTTFFRVKEAMEENTDATAHAWDTIRFKSGV